MIPLIYSQQAILKARHTAISAQILKARLQSERFLWKGDKDTGGSIKKPSDGSLSVLASISLYLHPQVRIA